MITLDEGTEEAGTPCRDASCPLCGLIAEAARDVLRERGAASAMPWQQLRNIAHSALDRYLETETAEQATEALCDLVKCMGAAWQERHAK